MKNRMHEVVERISLEKYGKDMTFNDGMSDTDKLNMLLTIVNRQHKEIVNLCTDLKWAVSDLPPLQEAFEKLYNHVHEEMK